MEYLQRSPQVALGLPVPPQGLAHLRKGLELLPHLEAVLAVHSLLFFLRLKGPYQDVFKLGVSLLEAVVFEEDFDEVLFLSNAPLILVAVGVFEHFVPLAQGFDLQGGVVQRLVDAAELPVGFGHLFLHPPFVEAGEDQDRLTEALDSLLGLPVLRQDQRFLVESYRVGLAVLQSQLGHLLQSHLDVVLGLLHLLPLQEHSRAEDEDVQVVQGSLRGALHFLLDVEGPSQVFLGLGRFFEVEEGFGLGGDDERVVELGVWIARGVLLLSAALEFLLTAFSRCTTACS